MEDGYHKDVLKKHANINPTPYKISTITATGDINAHIQLDVLFAEIPLAAKAFASSTWGFSSAQFSTDGIVVRRSALDDKGEPLPVQKSSRRKRRPTRHFDNQCTLIYWELDRTVDRGVNVKCFKNGRVQMTGVRTVDEGARVVECLVSTINAIPGVLEDASISATASNYKVCLINSDFCLGYLVKRDKLHGVLVKSLGLICSYEPCIYPGVKLSFMWNHGWTAKNEHQPGRCACVKPCNGTGDGYGPGCCRKVTVAIFQSGCAIITGAHNYTQLEDTYGFVCEVASTYRAMLEKISPIV